MGSLAIRGASDMAVACRVASRWPAAECARDSREARGSIGAARAVGALSREPPPCQHDPLGARALELRSRELREQRPSQFSAPELKRPVPSSCTTSPPIERGRRSFERHIGGLPINRRCLRSHVGPSALLLLVEAPGRCHRRAHRHAKLGGRRHDRTNASANRCRSEAPRTMQRTMPQPKQLEAAEHATVSARVVELGVDDRSLHRGRSRRQAAAASARFAIL